MMSTVTTCSNFLEMRRMMETTTPGTEARRDDEQSIYERRQVSENRAALCADP
jgi:hypothetical protein